nr:hypothetical protein [Tanacetum cinerariifolium]
MLAIPSVLIGGDSPIPTIVVDGVVQPVSHKSAEQKLARRNELKARGTLLMALPDKHQLKFNSHKDAKTLMEAIEKRFGGNTETKKVQKTLLKQQFENFTGSSSESLDQIHDRLQNLVSQLEIHGVSVSRRCNPTQNLAFVSSSNTDSTTDSVSAATSVSAVCAKLPLDNEDLKQIDVDDLEEMDLRWQMAMLTMRARRFLQKTYINLGDNRVTSMGFDMSKVKCYNCHRKGHFTRECRSLKDSRRSGSYDWSYQAEEEPVILLLWLLHHQALLLIMRLQPSGGYHVVPPPLTGTFMPPKPDLVFHTAPIAVETDHSAFIVQLNHSKPAQDLSHTNRPYAPIIEDWPIEAPIPDATLKPTSPKSNSSSKRKNRKTCFVCRSVDHLIKDCNYHAMKNAQPTPMNYAHRSKPVSITAARPVCAAVPKIMVPRPRHAHSIARKSKSPIRRHITRIPSPKTSNSSPKITAAQALVVSAAKGKRGTWGNPQYALKDKGVIDSGCSRYMTGNMSYLSDFEELNGGYVAFEGNPKGGKISGKGKIKTVDLLGCFFLATKDETSPILKTFITGLENQLSLKVKVIRSDNGIEFKNSGLNQFCELKGIKRESSVPRTPQQNGIAEKKNRTLNEAARTMLAESLLPRDLAYDAFDEKEHDAKKPKSEVNVSPSSSAQSGKQDDKTKKKAKGKSSVESSTENRDLSAEFEDDSDNSSNDVNTAGFIVPTAGPTHGKSSFKDASQLPDNPNMLEMEDITYSDHENVDAEADFNNLETSITVSPIPTTRTHKDHPVSQIIGDLSSTTQTRKEPKRVHQALKDPSWIEAIQEELLQFKMQKVWILVDLPHEKRAIDVKSAFLYGTIEEEVYVFQPPGFEEPNHPDKVYKVVKELYGLHQAPRAWSMIGSLMYLTSLRPGIMFADSPFDLVAYSDSDYAGASLDRKSTTRGCQFLGCRLISWQCKKQTVVATLSTEAEYVAAASCCAQVLWIQSQLLDYGYIKYAFTVNPHIYVSCVKQFWNTVTVKQSNDVTRLQALVDRKKVVILEAVIRDVLRLADAEGVDCLPNDEIFTGLARMGYEKPSVKLTFYKDFFSSQWKFLIHTILQSMSTKRTSWNEFSSAMASAVICLSTGRKFNFSKYIFDSLVRNVDNSSKFYMYPRFIQLIIQNQLGDLLTHTTKYISPALTQKVFANIRRVGKGLSRVETPLFEGMLVAGENVEEDIAEERVQDDAVVVAIQEGVTAAVVEDEALNACVSLTRRVEHLEHDKVAQDLEITKLKTRVKKLERANKGRMIDELDRDEGAALMGEKEEEKKVEEVKDITDEPEVQEVVEVVTTAKLITEVVTAASTPVSAASIIIPAAEPKVPASKLLLLLPDEEEEWLSWIQKRNQLQKLLLKPSPRTRVKAKEDPYVQRLEYFKGMSYDDIRPIFKAKFNSNIEFLLKSKEQIEEEENRAIESINETPAQKVTKRRKMNEDVEDLKQYLEIVPDEDNDVYTEATPLARKVPVVDYQIVHFNNKPHYKIIRADGTHQLYASFITLMKNFDREDLESLPDGQDQVWKSQRSVHGQARVKSWKLLESYGVHIITFTTTQMILLVERRYPLSRFTLDQMLNTVRLQVEEQSEMSLELLRFTRQQLQEG